MMITFIFLDIFLVPLIRVYTILPLSFNDAVPILNGSISVIGIGQYIILLFFMGDYINNKEKIFKICFQANVVFIALSVFSVFTSIGTLGSSVVARMPTPFLVAIKHIAVLDIIERI